MLGCIRIGAIASPGTVQSTAKDIAYRATAAKARSVVVSSEMVDKATEALDGLSIAQISLGDPRPGWQSYRELDATVAPLLDNADTAADAPALTPVPNGHTGLPKSNHQRQRKETPKHNT